MRSAMTDRISAAGDPVRTTVSTGQVGTASATPASCASASATGDAPTLRCSRRRHPGQRIERRLLLDHAQERERGPGPLGHGARQRQRRLGHTCRIDRQRRQRHQHAARPARVGRRGDLAARRAWHRGITAGTTVHTPTPRRFMSLRKYGSEDDVVLAAVDDVKVVVAEVGGTSVPWAKHSGRWDGPGSRWCAVSP